MADINEMEQRMEKKEMFVSIGTFKFKDHKNQGVFLRFSEIEKTLASRGLTLHDVKGVHFVKFMGQNNKFNLFAEMNDNVDPNKLKFAKQPEVRVPDYPETETPVPNSEEVNNDENHKE